MLDILRWTLHWLSSVASATSTPLAATVYGPNNETVIYGPTSDPDIPGT